MFNNLSIVEFLNQLVADSILVYIMESPFVFTEYCIDKDGHRKSDYVHNNNYLILLIL